MKATTRSSNLVGKLAAYFLARPGEWIDWRHIASIAGGAAWRTRISDARRAPWNLQILNRQVRAERGDGSFFTVSEYQYCPVVVHERPETFAEAEAR